MKAGSGLPHSTDAHQHQCIVRAAAAVDCMASTAQVKANVAPLSINNKIHLLAVEQVTCMNLARFPLISQYYNVYLQ